MPVHRVKVDGKEGWQYGQTGKVYYGPDARKKAEAQAAAIHASQAKRASLTYREVLEKMAAANEVKIPKNEFQRAYEKLMKLPGYDTRPPKQKQQDNKIVIRDASTKQWIKIEWSPDAPKGKENDK